MDLSRSALSHRVAHYMFAAQAFTAAQLESLQSPLQLAVAHAQMLPTLNEVLTTIFEQVVRRSILMYTNSCLQKPLHPRHLSNPRAPANHAHWLRYLQSITIALRIHLDVVLA